jgi:hypothetical protein
MSILDQYITARPAAQNALDIFRTEWSSELPAETGLKAGQAALFEDQRLVWAAQLLRGFNGYRVLELGPLEAGHTYMLERGGAKSILAIEANTKAYLKCLIIKEVLNLTRARFMLGDFVAYLRESNERFDLCLASGVLYHMLNPVELIYLTTKVSDKLLLWTHYYDQGVVDASPNLARRFSQTMDAAYRGFQHTLHKYDYLDALNWGGFCGGSAPYSFWMSKEEILACLRYFGLRDLRIEFDTLEHPNGPAFCVLGMK